MDAPLVVEIEASRAGEMKRLAEEIQRGKIAERMLHAMIDLAALNGGVPRERYQHFQLSGQTLIFKTAEHIQMERQDHDSDRNRASQ